MIKNISNAIDNPLAGAHPFKCLFGIGIILVHFSILVGAAVIMTVSIHNFVSPHFYSFHYFFL